MSGVSTRRITSYVIGAGLLASACGGSDSTGPDDLADASIDEDITVTSPAWEDGNAIPVNHTCDGDDVSPALTWDGVPDDAVELAVVVDDPDAAGDPFVHWVVFGIDPATAGIDEGTVPDGAKQATNSADDNTGEGWFGSCPPPDDDAHTYRFSVYALDEEVDAGDGDKFGDVLGPIKDAAIAKGVLTGTFDH
jgi:Raf kinase inhibitor-like YbhB/YbcL family protein